MAQEDLQATIASKQARLAKLEANEYIAKMSDDFYYMNGGDREIKTLRYEIQELTKRLHEEPIPQDVYNKAEAMYAAYVKRPVNLREAGESIMKYWIGEAKKNLNT